MKNLITYFIKYPVWANVVKILIMGFGLLALLNMKSSFFAELESNFINIQITYPGASPEEIEQGVVQKIEDNLKGIKGIDRYTSQSRENTGSITIEVFRSANMDDVFRDVENAVERINSFPAGMEPIVVAKQPSTEFAISFGIYGIDDLNTLKKIARDVEYELRGMDGISQVSLSGFPEEEIVTYLDEEDMRRYEISFDQVARALRAANIDLTAGSIKGENEEILIRLEEKEYYAESLLDIPVKSMPDGRVIYIRDIGEIRNTWAEIPQSNYINGERAVMVTVNKIIGENILDITDMVREYIIEFNEKETQAKATIIDDFTDSLRERQETLINNGIAGAILIILSLALFLNIRLAFWVALSIPFSFLGMFLIGYLFGLTINVLSLFGCIVVVGILVDDGIVVAEQIYQKYERGEKPFNAALFGTLEILPSVFFAVSTTVVMFSAFYFLDGRQGASMKDLALVVSAALIFSMIEAAIILPSHLAHSKALRIKKGQNKFRNFVEKFLLVPRDKLYAPSLRFFIKYRYASIGLVIAITIVTVGMISGGHIKTTFFPYIDSNQFTISLKMPPGTREGITKSYLEEIQKAVWEVNKVLSSKRDDGEEVIKKVVMKVGQTAAGANPMMMGPSMGSSNNGVLQVILLSGEIREYESAEIANMVREKMGPVYEADELIYGGGTIFGKPISFTLVSPNRDDLESVKAKLKDRMSQMTEIYNVADNDPEGMREVKLKLKPEAYLLGLNNLEIARQVRQGFFGDEVQRLQRGQDEVKVWVKYSMEDRSSMEKFEQMRIRVPAMGNNPAAEYPLTELADFEIERGSIVINHIDGKREITIDADVVNSNEEVPKLLEKIGEEILNPLLAEYPSVTTAESGQRREVMKMASSAQLALNIAFILMFFLVVLSFRSFLQAVVVFLLIPFGLIGAFWGHWFQGIVANDVFPVNIMSAYGIIALIGIIVNNSIVYINTMNRFLKEGMTFKEAVFEAGINRFRPILLTTVTTVLGLLPLLGEKSIQAKFLIPMAVSVAYGLMVGATFVLVYLPVFINILNDFKFALRWLWEGKKPEREDVEPAVIEERDFQKYFG
jgi:multidrug efflux pump subunit AcrB